MATVSESRGSALSIEIRFIIPGTGWTQPCENEGWLTEKRVSKYNRNFFLSFSFFLLGWGGFHSFMLRTSAGIRTICGQSRGRCHVHQKSRGAGGDASRSRSPHRPVAWRTEADPDDAVPQPPKFRPKRTPGIQPPLNAAQSPGDIFSKFFDDEVLKCLCENTNKNATKKRKRAKRLHGRKLHQKNYKSTWVCYFTWQSAIFQKW